MSPNEGPGELSRYGGSTGTELQERQLRVSPKPVLTVTCQGPKEEGWSLLSFYSKASLTLFSHGSLPGI